MIIVPLDSSSNELANAIKNAFLFPFRLFGAVGLLIGGLIFNLLKLALIVIFLPVIPYLVAYFNRKTYPKMCKAIVWLWSIIWALSILIIILDANA
ncbi:MAG: hypothetical protein K2L01_06990 [Rikenellaceae bacterium]|nr:hypothetical protein [Rikenellaceae bacterium]